jgi:cytohesin
MKHLLLTTIAAVVLVGCGPSVDIHEAASKGNIAVVKQHLAAGTDVDTRDDAYGGQTPLHWAAVGNNKELAELLIANGADVNARDKDGDTPLDLAFKTEIADLLRKHGGKTGEELPPTTKALDISIHEAANEGNIEAVKQRIADGVDVNAKAEYGRTPLHWAAWVGHKEIVELLITSGADVNVKGVGGITPLDSAINVNLTEIAALLRKHGGKTSAWLNADNSIHAAAIAGHIEAVKQHLDAGTDVNAKDIQFGATPLYLAAEFGRKEVAALLLAKGAEVNARDKSGATPLGGAIRRKHSETADLLRKHGGKTGEELKAEEK